ncbi:MAG: UDP-N-acetylmuramoyl-L-alanyl-D-glutamate--2,6-diaminopimelate ligase [Candidatus Saganbacteria bacterium]|nr:UDP-N-acetylmuramoyl-L-alanyl-D-glutamate--2,6-diaminopimelate ligase [Candidatus Saganbacteria bacterium]
MKLEKLLEKLKNIDVSGNTDADITGIAYNSKSVKPGNIFVAIPGFVSNGHDYVREAIAKGASACVLEVDMQIPVSKMIVKNARAEMARLAAAFYDHPSQKLKVIGVTGTNGKTTICYILESLLRRAGYKVGLIGTIETRIDGRVMPSKLTTPESVDLQKILNTMVEEGATHVVMEVSSHSLALDRVLGVDFDLVVYTNLTHDHLDFHKTMEEYLEAKLKLFRTLGTGEKKEAIGIVNKDDICSKKVLEALRGKALTYGLDYSADLSAKDIKFNLDSMSFKAVAEKEFIEVTSNLIGIPNVYNILASTLCGLSLGLDLAEVKEGIESLPKIPGRYERIAAGRAFNVIVDFAHSPDSLQKLIETFRPFAQGKIILVFGCPGDRDKLKRPIMGEIAAKLADHTIITTDDPHTEDPAKIIDEIEKGITSYTLNVIRYEKIIDRREAIEKALSLAGEGDIVLIAGRGHEKFQDFNGRKIEIDDREVVRNCLRK